LEPLLANLFGPEGYFAKSKGSTYDNVKNYVTQAINYAKGEQNAVDSESSSKQVNCFSIFQCVYCFSNYFVFQIMQLDNMHLVYSLAT